MVDVGLRSRSARPGTRERLNFDLSPDRQSERTGTNTTDLSKSVYVTGKDRETIERTRDETSKSMTCKYKRIAKCFRKL